MFDHPRHFFIRSFSCRRVGLSVFLTTAMTLFTRVWAASPVVLRPPEELFGKPATTLNVVKEHGVRGRILEQQGNPSGALKEYQEAIAELDTFEKGSLQVSQQDPHLFLLRGSANLDAARVFFLLTNSSNAPMTAQNRRKSDG